MQVDLSTLIEVSIQFKDDIDSAADYVMQNVLPDIIIPDPSHPNPNDDLYIHGKVRSYYFKYLILLLCIEYYTKQHSLQFISFNAAYHFCLTKNAKTYLLDAYLSVDMLDQ